MHAELCRRKTPPAHVRRAAHVYVSVTLAAADFRAGPPPDHGNLIMGARDRTTRSSEPALPFAPSPPLAPDDGAPPRGTAQDMLAHIARSGAVSGADALRELRTAFPDSPLTLRVAVLRQLASRGGSPHIPR
jgi:hypothetical protein